MAPAVALFHRALKTIDQSEAESFCGWLVGLVWGILFVCLT